MHSLIFLSVIFAVSVNIALAAPIPSPWSENFQKGVSNSGSGGQANGGNVESDSLPLEGLFGLIGCDGIDLFSGNGGEGGKATSGPANSYGNSFNGPDASPGDETKEFNDTEGSAYSGSGGGTNGGNVIKHGNSCLALGSSMSILCYAAKIF